MYRKILWYRDIFQYYIGIGIAIYGTISLFDVGKIYTFFEIVNSTGMARCCLSLGYKPRTAYIHRWEVLWLCDGVVCDVCLSCVRMLALLEFCIVITYVYCEVENRCGCCYTRLGLSHWLVSSLLSLSLSLSLKSEVVVVLVSLAVKLACGPTLLEAPLSGTAVRSICSMLAALLLLLLVVS